MNINEKEPDKKTGNKTTVFVILGLLILAIGICVGVFGTKLFANKDNKAEVKETKKDESNKEDSEEKEEPKGTPEYITIETKDVSNMTLFKKEEKTIQVGDANYTLTYEFYEYKSDLISEDYYGLYGVVSLNGKNITEDFIYAVHKDNADNDIQKIINDTVHIKSELKDKITNDKYLIFYYPYTFGNSPLMLNVVVTNTNGDVYFKKEMNPGYCFFWVNNKDEVLDRISVEAEPDNYNFKHYNVDPSGYYSLYKDNSSHSFGSLPVEFKEDHFYAFDAEREGPVDYMYVIENGVLKKTLLKDYRGDNSVVDDGAGQGCPFILPSQSS